MSVSKPAPSFTVTAASQKVTLDDSGTGRASFTVTNTSQQALRGRLVARPLGTAKADWFTVPDAVRDFAPDGAQQAVVQLKVPRGATPGSYSFRLDAVAEDDPDEDFTEGPSVAFDVKAPPKPKKKFPWWILIVVGALVLLAIIGVVIWLLVRDTGPETAPVPRVTGEPRAVAENRLADAGFRVNVQFVPVSELGQHGVVQSQDPVGGTIHPLNEEVRINVGRMSTVPVVTGLPEEEATTRLTAADLRSRVRFVGVADRRQHGIVQSQDPAGGTLQPPGTVVTVDVGRMATVPDVTRLRQADAIARIAAADLRSSVREVPVQNPQEDGIVQRQDPPPRTLQPPGTVVTIDVGRNVLVPEVVGDPLDVALDKITGVGLRPNVLFIFGPAEIVLSQIPAPNTRLPLGGTVTIRVGRPL